jgi:hypothetical protein
MNTQVPCSCYDKTWTLFYFARMCSKIRIKNDGLLDESYLDMLGAGFDGRTCRYLQVDYLDVKAEVLSGKSNEEVLTWCFEDGRNLTDEEILIYNSFMSKRGWRDDETRKFIPNLIESYGVKPDSRLVTDFDVIEMDEGRWYPEQWQDAWY